MPEFPQEELIIEELRRLAKEYRIFWDYYMYRRGFDKLIEIYGQEAVFKAIEKPGFNLHHEGAKDD